MIEFFAAIGVAFVLGLCVIGFVTIAVIVGAFLSDGDS